MLTFRALGPKDFARLEVWLKDPAVARWFDDPDEIDTLRAHGNDARVRQWMVFDGPEPVAYLQDYEIHGWADHPLGFLPQGSRGMDTFVGKPSDRGRGIGRRFLRAHAKRMFADGVPAIGIDPHPDNSIAYRAYLAVGFRPKGGVLKSEWGLIQPMELWPGDLET